MVFTSLEEISADGLVTLYIGHFGMRDKVCMNVPGREFTVYKSKTVDRRKRGA